MFQKFWGVIFFLAFSPAAWAYDFYTGGIYYNITSRGDKTVEVTYDYLGANKDHPHYWGDMTIPETVSYKGTVYSVTAIGNYAFYECDGLTSVMIPESVTTIGNYAFYKCEGLTSITIPESVTTIDNGAFSNCTSLTEITIPGSVTTIGSQAFAYCENLTEVTIGNSVTTIGDEAFSYCKSLEKFEGKFTSNGCCLIVNDTLVAFAPKCEVTKYIIPDGVTTIGNSAFSDCTDLTSVTIGEGVTTIGAWAFQGCTGLTSVTIGNSVTTIGAGAFQDCINLGEFKGKLASEDGHCLVINDTLKAFARGGLTQYTIPDNVKVIGNEAFSYCRGLTSVTIPESVTSIGEDAFYECESLTSVTIPNSVTTIGAKAFEGCTGLTSVTIPESVTSIGSYAFSCDSVYFKACYCSMKYYSIGATMVYIGENVRWIPEGAFYKLKEVWFKADSCISGSFSECSSLTTVHIGENVKYFPDNAFSNCRGLKKFEGKFAEDNGRCLIVNDTLKAFAPSGLTEYTIPGNVKVIGNYAFYNCDSLTSVTIPDNITSIGNSAFYYCSGLTSVTIPESVTSIGSNAFSYCSNLQTITPLGTIPPTISNNTFNSNTYKKATVNYPKGSLHAYKTADGWKNFTYPTVQELLNLHFTADSVGETKYHCTVSYTRDIEYPVSKLYMSADEKEYPVDADTTLAVIPLTVIDLEPETEYDAQFIIETIYGDQIVTPVTFTTDTVHLTAQPAKTTDVKATLEAAVECDAETGYGFEWRRYGAPDNLPPTRVEAYNIDGKIAGTLRNLTPEAYYEFRPYYRTVSGKYYYDEWVAFGTFDYGVEWDPTVSTRAGEVEGNNSTISAYVVEGSDELLSQGFEYWAESPAARSTESIAARSTASEPERIEGSGSLMSVTLTGLDYNTTYYYRAYATTAKKTTYGNTESFTTGKAPVVQDFKPSGINPTDNSEVEALKTITLIFTEKPALAAEAQTITLAGNDTLLTATLSAGDGNRLVVTLADTLKVAGEYTLTIPEGTFGDADFAADPAFGHCNPELVYTFTITEPEPAEPDEPENPDDPSAVTETQQDAEHITVYNLQGVLVLETDDAADLKTLQNGAYIVNGKKMIIVR